MCGIAGIVALDPRANAVDATPLRAMLSCLAHRGPDDEGEFCAHGIALGHRRLSIIDLTGGHQPLFGARESTVIIVNGEIYNYRELARELGARGHRFRTASDSEVAAHAYDEWGLDFLERLDGMFALALWDATTRRLVLARDRMGEKPLYYSVGERSLLFASELTALLKHPDFDRSLDFESLSTYLAMEYVPAPRTILKAARKLEPGTAIVLENGELRTLRYWQVAVRASFEGSYREAVRELRRRLEAAVASRLVSDVPLGIFLSGGIDSSVVAALAARRGALDTFSIGFEEKSFDESRYARLVAKRIGSNHHERILKGEDMPALVPQLARMLDEPLGDASFVPTVLLSAFTREHVTVALGGDGGDELFAGYPMHQAQRVAAFARALPRAARAFAGQTVSVLPVAHRNFAFTFKAQSFLRGAGEAPPYNHALWMSSFSPEEQQPLLTHTAWHASGRAAHAFAAVDEAWQSSQDGELLARATHLDALTYLPNDILMKVDRASMRVALEVRAPFLARDVVEFAFSVPDRFRMRGLAGKRMLRDAVRDLLPKPVIERPKKGFGIPVAAWLNGPLRELVNDVFAADALRAADIFRVAEVHRMLTAHARREVDYRKPLWTLLVFELWRREYLA